MCVLRSTGCASYLPFSEHLGSFSSSSIGQRQNGFIRNLSIDCMEPLREKPQKWLSKQSSSDQRETTSHIELSFLNPGHRASLLDVQLSQHHFCASLLLQSSLGLLSIRRQTSDEDCPVLKLIFIDMATFSSFQI